MLRGTRGDDRNRRTLVDRYASGPLEDGVSFWGVYKNLEPMSPTPKLVLFRAHGAATLVPEAALLWKEASKPSAPRHDSPQGSLIPGASYRSVWDSLLGF